MSPSQDTVMGCYYISVEQPGRKGEGMIFSSLEECETAYQMGVAHLHAKVKVRLPRHRKREKRRR